MLPIKEEFDTRVGIRFIINFFHSHVSNFFLNIINNNILAININEKISKF